MKFFNFFILPIIIFSFINISYSYDFDSLSDRLWIKDIKIEYRDTDYDYLLNLYTEKKDINYLFQYINKVWFYDCKVLKKLEPNELNNIFLKCLTDPNFFLIIKENFFQIQFFEST